MSDPTAAPWDGALSSPEALAALVGLVRFDSSPVGRRPPDFIAPNAQALDYADTITVGFSEKGPHRVEVIGIPGPGGVPYQVMWATRVMGSDQLTTGGGRTTAGDMIAVWASAPPTFIRDSQANWYVTPAPSA